MRFAVIACVLGCSLLSSSVWAEVNQPQEMTDEQRKTLIDSIKKTVKDGKDVNARNSDGCTPLFLACHAGDVSLVRTILAAGGQPDLANNKGFTALHAAAASGNAEVASIILGVGADVNVTSHDQISPLYTATLNNQLEMVQYLLKYGADEKLAKQGGWLPVHAAASSGYIEILIAFLDHGMSADSINLQNGFSLLCDAASSGQLESCKVLLQRGADVNLLSYYHWSPLMYAVNGEKVEVVELLLKENANVDGFGNGGMNPLLLAVKKNHTSIAQMLLEKGADPTVMDSTGKTVLDYAAKNNNEAMLRTLVRNGVDVNMVNGEGQTCFFANSVIYYTNPPVLKVLKSLNAEPGIPDVDDISDNLYFMDRAGEKATAERLREMGVKKAPRESPAGDVNAMDFMGNTKLHYAAFKSSQKDVEDLIAQHALINAVNHYGMTPLHYVKYNDATRAARTIQLMLAAGADPTLQDFKGETVLHGVARDFDGFPDVLQDVIRRGADVNQPNRMGFYPLHIAYRYPNLMTILIRQGADLEVRNRDGHTPLTYAVIKDKQSTAKLLLENGADVNAQAYTGYTPVHFAAWQGKTRTISMLAQHGADLTIKSYAGESALDLAKKNKQVAAVTHLEKLMKTASSQPTLAEPEKADTFNKEKAAREKLLEKQQQQKDEDAMHRSDWMYHCQGKPLALAVLQSDPNAVMQAVEGGADLNEYFVVGVSYHYTALYMATRFQDEAMIRLLVKRGADVNLGEKEPFLQSPLHLAAKKGWVDMTRLLLELGADMTIEDGGGDPPFFAAALKGRRQIVRLYKEAGFDMNFKDSGGKSLLHRAVQWSSTIKYLLAEGLDPNVKTDSGRTPLHSYMMTVGTDTAAVPKLLVQYGADVNAADKYGNTPLCEALSHDKLATARFLIESGADVNVGRSGWAQTGPAIHLTKGNLEIARLLIEAGADVSSKDSKGCNVIHNMIKHSGGMDDVAALEFFLENGVDINGRDKEQQTPLFYCVEYERVDLLDTLIQEGADVHAEDSRGRTPLWHAAAKTKSKIMVKQLVKHGAKTELQDKNGHTLQKELETWKQQDMLTFIQSL